MIKILKNKLVQYTTLFFMVSFCSSALSQTNDLSVLVLYNQSFATNNNPNTWVTNAINAANTTYANSGMDVRLVVVGNQQFDLPVNHVGEAMLSELISNQGVWAIQNIARPDITIYIGDDTPNACGMAKFPINNSIPGRPPQNPTSKFYAVASAGWQCAEQSFIHEIGHVLGAGHGPVDRSGTSDILFGLVSVDWHSNWHEGFPISNSVGHGVFDQFRTIMAYPDTFGSAPRIYQIANPAVNWSGMQTGLNDRNAASGMDQVALDYVRWNSACYPASVRKNKWGQVIGRNCDLAQHCTNWEQRRIGRLLKNICVAWDPN